MSCVTSSFVYRRCSVANRDVSSVVAAIGSFGWGVRVDAVLREGSEVRVSLDAKEFLGFADFLRDSFGGQPELIVAEDTRQTAGAFTLRYIFEFSDPNGFVVATTLLESGQRLF